MNITIIGAGNIGRGLAGVLSTAGHDVVTADRNDDLAAAVARAETVILATPYGAAASIAAAADFDGKIVVDVSNPITDDFSGLQLGFDTSAAEEIAKLVPGARVVKAFNTIFAGHYADGLKIDGRPLQALVASDDAAAKAVVTQLAKDIGLVPVDAGPLGNARYLEPLGFMNIQFGFVLGLGGGVAPHWLGA